MCFYCVMNCAKNILIFCRNVAIGITLWVVVLAITLFIYLFISILIIVISSETNAVFLKMHINTPKDVWMMYTKIHSVRVAWRPTVFIKLFVDVTWTTADIWYIVTHEIMRDCVLPPAEMEFSVMEKRSAEVRALDSFIWWILRVRCLSSVQSDSMQWITCDPTMCSSEPAQY